MIAPPEAVHQIGWIDPLAEFLIMGAQMKQAMLEQAGGVLTAGQVAELLGITPQAVQQRARRGTLLALTMGSDERLYPVVQFTEKGVVPGMEKILAAFNVEDPWMRLSVLLDTDEALGGQRVIDALRNGEMDGVTRVVRSFAG